MKTHIIIFAILLTGLAGLGSCSENEKFPVRDKGLLYPIEFGTYLGRTVTSKAGDTFKESGATFVSGDAFAVFSYYHDNGVFSNSSSTPDFMLNQRVEYDGTAWSYSPIKYWPNETGGNVSADTDRLSFFAYYPPAGGVADTTGIVLRSRGTTNPYGENSVGLPDFYFEQRDTVDRQIDLMFSEFAAGAERNLTKPAVDVPVTFTFKHALSQVSFEVELVSGMTMVVKTMTLTGPYGSGTCTLNPSDPSALAYTWATSGSRRVYTLENASGDATKLLMIPQPITSEFVLHLEYDLEFEGADKGDDGTSPGTTIVYSDNVCDARLDKMLDGSGNVVSSTVTSWLPGKKYIYKINPGLDRIEFSEIVERSWTLEWPEE